VAGNRPEDVALLDRLERGGGTVVARARRGAFVVLSRASRPVGGTRVTGLIPEAMIGPDMDQLVARGWLAGQRGLEREWSAATASGKSTALREVGEAIDILAERRGMSRRDVVLQYESPLGSDPGYAQAGFLIAGLGGLIGNGMATVALVLSHPDWIDRGGAGAAVVGLAIGWFVALVIAVVAGFIVAVAITSVFDRSQRTERHSVPLYYVALFSVPLVVAAATLWLLASVNR
jgi:hypothetical protein